MKALQEPAPGAADGEWWARMERVFSLEEQVRFTSEPVEQRTKN